MLRLLLTLVLNSSLKHEILKWLQIMKKWLRCGKMGLEPEIYKHCPRSKELKCRQCNRDEAKLQRNYKNGPATGGICKTLTKHDIMDFMHERGHLDKKPFQEKMR